jgi:hypothetical protein
VTLYGSVCVVRDTYERDKNEPTEAPQAMTNTRSVCVVSWLLIDQNRDVWIVSIFYNGRW